MTTTTDSDSVSNHYERPRSGEISIETENVFSESNGGAEDPIEEPPGGW